MNVIQLDQFFNSLAQHLPRDSDVGHMMYVHVTQAEPLSCLQCMKALATCSVFLFKMGGSNSIVINVFMDTNEMQSSLLLP